jgi:hypothetical protein
MRAVQLFFGDFTILNKHLRVELVLNIMPIYGIALHHILKFTCIDLKKEKRG